MFALKNCQNYFLLNTILSRTKDDRTKQKLWYYHVFGAGCCGGVLKAIAACPIELTKVRLQVRVSKYIHKFNIILQQQNVLSLFHF